MICNEAHILTAIQITEDVTPAERAVIQQIHRYAEVNVRNHLGFDPDQGTRTREYYPRNAIRNAIGFRQIWSVNAAHTHARMESLALGRETIQLANIPLRSISSLEVDENARFGSASSPFPSGSAWTEGEDYWADWELDGLCKSGLLYASGSWPVNPGSVRITYVSGYSRAELEGTGGQVDASGILGAVVKTAITGFHKFKAWQRNKNIGFGGPIRSEKAQDYSYQLSPELSRELSFFATLPREAVGDLQEYVHRGLMRV